MEDLFKIDGRGFSGVGVEALKRSFRIPDGPNAGDMLAGNHERDIIGVYYDYDLTISTRDLSNHEYEALFAAISAPVNSHLVEMPFGLGSIAFEAMIQAGSDELIPMDEDGTWWGNLNVSFLAKSPYLTTG